MENCTELKDDAHLNSTMFGRICPSEELAWWVAVIEIISALLLQSEFQETVLLYMRIK